MNKFLHYAPMLGYTLLFAGLSTSCIDKSYDFDDTDFTLGVETNITLPTCSTGDILLRNFMDLKKDGVIQYIWSEELQDSVFCVRETGTTDFNPIHIGEIRIAKPNITPIRAHITLRKTTNVGKRARISINTPMGPQDVEVADCTFIYDLKQNDAKYSIYDATACDISHDITDIQSVGINDVEVTMNFHFDGFPSYISMIHPDNLKMTLPQGLEVSNCLFNGKPCREKDGIIHITEEHAEGILIKDGIEMKMTIKGISSGESMEFIHRDHSVNLHGDFTINGVFRIESSEFESAELNKKLESLSPKELQDFMNGNWDILTPQSVDVDGNAMFGSDIVIHTFCGKIEHHLGRIDPIKLDDLPDFLNDDEVVLDLDNPILLLNIEHNVPVTPVTGFSLVSPTCPEPVITESFEVLPGNNKFYIADRETQDLPEAYRNAQPLPFSGSVPALFRRIPEYITVNAEPIRFRADHLDITRPYDVDLNYEIFAPLTFGENFKMVYSKSEHGWASDLDDLENVNAELLELKGLVDSDLPAECELTLVPIDEYGNEIHALEVNTIQVPENSKNQEVLIRIRAAEGYTFNDVLAGNNGVNRLDGVRYTARLMGKPNSTLTREAGLRLHSVKVSIKGTVSYDAN